LFASEIKALFAFPELKREPNFEALQEHLARCHSSGIHTAMRGIFRLGPGKMLNWRSSNHSFQIKPFHNLDFSENSHETYHEAEESVRSGIRAAVKRQMISDVPMGSLFWLQNMRARISSVLRSPIQPLKIDWISLLMILPTPLRFRNPLGSRKS